MEESKAREDELWIIERPPGEDVRGRYTARYSARPGDVSARDGDHKPQWRPPRSGGLVVAYGQESQSALPLEHTDVQARIDCFVATVDVTQRFQNPYTRNIEASYVFPLPHNAGIHGFVMKIGDRRIRGIIREREEARRIYERARERGHTAALLSQKRPNIFVQKVANIEPGRVIDVEIRYFHTLAYSDGWYEYVFPMVVGPRFNPPGSPDVIRAVSWAGRSMPRAGPDPVHVPYLEPGERGGHDISLRVDVDAGVAIEELKSVNHDVSARWHSAGAVTASLDPHETIPNKDFVLRFRVASDRLKTTFMTHRDERGGFFTLALYPPRSVESVRRRPVEFVFVIDTSGSMKGKPLDLAKHTIRRTLRKLDRDDTFQIVRFSNDASSMSRRPVRATRRAVADGEDYLRRLGSGGGTMMIHGIERALQMPQDPERLRIVSFVTDGYIGNEDEIFAVIRRDLGTRTRIFSFGVGSSVNRHLLEGMARHGRGAAAFVGLDESTARAVDGFYDRIRHPVISDVRIDWGALRAFDVFPREVPDLFVGRPVYVMGRFEGSGTSKVRVHGDIGAVTGEDSGVWRTDDGLRPATVSFTVDAENTGAAHAGIPLVWARRAIADMQDQWVDTRQPHLETSIQQLALDFGLVSSFTSFVAVDASRRAWERPVGVGVPASMPEGVKPEGSPRNR